VTLVGALLLLLGGGGAGWALTVATARRQPAGANVAAALLAPLCIACALIGAVLLFVPSFLR
jgi:hypothetical protein